MNDRRAELRGIDPLASKNIKNIPLTFTTTQTVPGFPLILSVSQEKKERKMGILAILGIVFIVLIVVVLL